MQTILGAGGVIGIELAKLLPEYTDRVRLVRRNPTEPGAGEETFGADLTQQRETFEAVRGSEVVYLTAGLPYKTSVWKDQWPKIMENVIDACSETGARLVFFDNVYMYGLVEGWMTEETPHNPCSRKGEVRARIAERLMDEVKRGSLEALIARSADFYGPGAVNTPFHDMVFGKLKAGKKALWLCNAELRHSITFTPDAAKAVAVLGNTPEAYGEVWHLPTDKNAMTGREMIGRIADFYRTEPQFSVLGKGMVTLGGLFDSRVMESREMLYQYEHEYLFDSTKFQDRFFNPTAYAEGIPLTAETI